MANKSKAKKDSKKRSSRRNKTQAGGNQSLINAVLWKDTNAVYNILNTGADVNYTNENGSTPLLAASHSGNLDIVRLLLNHGAMVQTPTSNFNALMEAAKSGHIHVVNELLDRGADPSWVDMFGMGIVEYVNRQGNQEMVNLLIDKGFRNEYYKREHAERDGVLAQYEQIVGRIMVSKVVRDATPYIPLELGDRIAAFIGGKRKTKKSKAKKDSKKRSSRRNKTQAGGAKTEHDMLYEVTEKYDHNEDVNKTDKTGKTFLHRASEKGYSMVVDQLLKYPTVDVNKIREETGKTALHYASKNGHWEVVIRLLTADKIDVNIQDKLGKTPLHYASENGDWMVVQILCTVNNINVNIRDELGKTPLHYAYHNGDPAVYGELILSGADKDVVDITGKKPEYYRIIDNDALIKNILTPGDAINVHDTDNDALLHSYPRTRRQTHPYSKK